MEESKTPDDKELDALMRQFLSSELDGQLGRAARHFRLHAAPGGAEYRAPRGPGPRRPAGGWVVGIIGGAIAASIAALWAGPALFPSSTPARRPGVIPVAQSPYHFDLDDVTLSTKTRDGGTVLLDGRTPARRIYRDELKQVRWVDASHDATFEKIEPRQTIMLIEMDTY